MNKTELAAAIAAKQQELADLIQQLLALGNGSTAPTPTPAVQDAAPGATLVIKSVDGKDITTDGSATVPKGSMVTFYNGRTTPVMSSKNGITLTTREAGADSEQGLKALVGTKLTVNSVPGVETPKPVPVDESGSIAPPTTTNPVGTTSVRVFDNEDWDGGVWNRSVNGSIRPGVVLPTRDDIVAGTVLLFSDGTKATVAETQTGANGNSSTWLDKRPDPAKIKANPLVTIVSTPAKVQEPTQGGTSTPGGRGSKRSLVKQGTKIRANHGQSGGGSKLRQAKMDYGYASLGDMQACKAAGFDGVRISLKWERIMPSLMGEIDKTYGDGLLAALKNYGKVFGPASVLICQAHNYGGYSFTLDVGNRVQLGTSQVPQGSLAYLTKKLTAFIMADKEAAAAVYGLDFMNEPINLSSFEVIRKEYQLCIDELRKQNQTWIAAVETYQWATTAGAADTFEQLAALNDPANKLEVHTHAYFDPDHGGDYVEPDSQTTDSKFMDKALELAKKTGRKHAFGELGAPSAVMQGGQVVQRPRTYAMAMEGLEKALVAGSDVYWWWWSEWQAGNGDNVNGISAPRNAQMLKGIQQYVAA